MKAQPKNSKKLKDTVKEKYGQISEQNQEDNVASCCGSTCGCDTVDYAIFAEDYSQLKGYNADADLGLGCGLPIEFAQIKAGDTVVDLGSGAGNDCFVARELTGETRHIIGLDITEKMVEKARLNTDKTDCKNIEFFLGDIENMLFDDNLADVVVSNCVLNLVPDKKQAFSEIFCILKPGGHFSISDVVIKGSLPDTLREAAELYAGCIAGAVNNEKYLSVIDNAGFKNVNIQKQKMITLPRELLKKYMDEQEIEVFKKFGSGIFSSTIYGEKSTFSSSHES